MGKKEEYGAEAITVLEGLEAVRRRPGMYIGSVTTKGLNHLIYEIVDNSVDEHLAATHWYTVPMLEGFEILAKADKANEQSVIKILEGMYR